MNLVWYLTGGRSAFSLTVTGLAPPKGFGLGPDLGTTSGSAFSSVSLPEREVDGAGWGCSTGSDRGFKASLGRAVEPPLLLVSRLSAAVAKAHSCMLGIEAFKSFKVI